MKKYLFTISFTILFQLVFSQEKNLRRDIKLQTPKQVVYYENDFPFTETYPNFKNREIITHDKIYYAENLSFKNINIPYSAQITSVKIIIQSLIPINSSIYKDSWFNKNTKTQYFQSFSNKTPILSFSFNPFISKNNTKYFVSSFQVKISYTSINQLKKTSDFVYSSVLSSGNWYKFKITNSGIYKISYEKLREIGFTNPSQVRVFGNKGGMLPQKINQGTQDDLAEKKIFTQNDTIYFYASSANSWHYDTLAQKFTHLKHCYSDVHYYFLTDRNTGFNNQIEPISYNQSPDLIINNYDFYTFKEEDKINLIESGRTWYGDLFDVNDELSFEFTASDFVPSSEAKINVKAAVRSFSSTSISTIYNNSTQNIDFSAVSGSYEASYAYDKSAVFSFPVSTNTSQKIRLKYNHSSPSDKAWVDYIEFQAKRKLKYNGSTFRFRNIDAVKPGSFAAFQIENANSAIVWNITDEANVKVLTLSKLDTEHSQFIYPANQLEEFIIFETKNSLTPELTGKNTGFIENQNLHSISSADMLIISHPAFLSYANELADFHKETDNLLTQVININQIYNEFSGGTPDITAIRNFLRMVYFRSQNTAHPLKLLCLFGDGTYKNKQAIAENWKMIPTYQSINSTNPVASYVSDDFYGMMDANEYETNGFLDIGIGRIPVDNTKDAQIVINKIKHYYEIHGEWKNDIALVADDEDGNTYVNDAEAYAIFLSQNYPEFNLDKIYLDKYKQTTTSAGDRYPDAVRAINAKMQKGCLIFNYVGHGNPYRLAHEKVIDIGTIESWKNFDALPVFMTATCEFSRYDKSDITSAGELVLLNPQGGAIALFTTTRLVFSGSNDLLNSNFYKNVFSTDTLSGKKLFMGEIVKKAKLATGSASNINKRNFCLLGDPALRLAYPTKKIRITKINSSPITYNSLNLPVGTPDTIKALQKVNIEGMVISSKNTLETTFNGFAKPRIFDKAVKRKTLANDGGYPIQFSERTNVVFNGRSEIKNGKFNFSLVVPKDIALNYDFGKISVFAYSSENTEAACSFSNFIIGGIDTLAKADEIGPEIKLYLNSENFVSGGMTNQSPFLYAILKDSSGINTASSAIGHDITATIDGNTLQTIVLNDFYEADLNQYSSGKIKYQLENLEAGEHTLKLKAWDVYNNSEEKTIDFTVAKDNILEIRHLYNYPNPFFNTTEFHFEHNAAYSELQISIQIFTLSGKLVKTIQHNIIPSGFESGAFAWDGLDDFGQKLGRGTYFYRLTIRSKDGRTAEKIEKLVKLN